jgi:hypothetical protein
MAIFDYIGGFYNALGVDTRRSEASVRPNTSAADTNAVSTNAA